MLGRTSIYKRGASSCEKELSGLEAKIQKIKDPMIKVVNIKINELKKQVDGESRIKKRAKHDKQEKIINATEPYSMTVQNIDTDTVW